MRGRGPYVALSFAVVVADQIAKWLIRANLELHEYHPLVTGLLSLSHVRNRGAAFGLGSDAELPYQPLVFAALSVIALGAITVYALRLPPSARLPQTALAFVLGGAVGNLIDRLRHGYVTDFIHVYWKHHQWPDFNVADSAITVGVCLLLLDMVRHPSHATDDAGRSGSGGRLGAASPLDPTTPA